MTAAEAKIFERLKARLFKYGCTVRQSGSVSYLAERWNMEWFLPTLEDVEEFFAQVKGGCHDL